VPSCRANAIESALSAYINNTRNLCSKLQSSANYLLLLPPYAISHSSLDTKKSARALASLGLVRINGGPVTP
jgi:hypothetical protein